jgi:hypothetical protein
MDIIPVRSGTIEFNNELEAKTYFAFKNSITPYIYKNFGLGKEIIYRHGYLDSSLELHQKSKELIFKKNKLEEKKLKVKEEINNCSIETLPSLLEKKRDLEVKIDKARDNIIETESLFRKEINKIPKYPNYQSVKKLKHKKVEGVRAKGRWITGSALIPAIVNLAISGEVKCCECGESIEDKYKLLNVSYQKALDAEESFNADAAIQKLVRYSKPGLYTIEEGAFTLDKQSCISCWLDKYRNPTKEYYRINGTLMKIDPTFKHYMVRLEKNNNKIKRNDKTSDNFDKETAKPIEIENLTQYKIRELTADKLPNSSKSNEDPPCTGDDDVSENTALIKRV